MAAYNITSANKSVSGMNLFTGLSTQFSPVSSLTAVNISRAGGNTVSSSTDIISDEVFNIVDTIISCFLVYVISIVGIFGNTLNGMILYRHGIKEPTNFLLMCLSITDFLYSICIPFRRSRSLIAKFDFALSITFKTFAEICLYVFSNICLSTSWCQVAAIAVERFMAVTFPFHISRVFTATRVKLMVAFIVIYNFSLCFPGYLKLTYSWVNLPGYNTTVAQYGLSRFALDNMNSMTYYENYIVNPLLSLVPLLIVLFCSAVIIFKLTISRDLTKLSSSASSAKSASKNMKVVKMLLAVCIVTIVSCLPTSLLDIYIAFINTNFLTATKTNQLKNSFQIVLYQMNASVNFIIYVTMSSKFSKTFKEICSSFPCAFMKKRLI